MRDAWLNEWLAKHPEWVLANDGEPGSRWLAEDGWMDTAPAASRPPFARRPKAVAWALVRDSKGTTMSVISDALKHGNDIYVCAECVKAEGGTAPEGHIGTAHDGECRQCGKQSWLTPLTDWNWPGRAGGVSRS